MFEKEAEEWVKNNLHSTEEDYIKAYKDGAEFGYNKANNLIEKMKCCANCKHSEQGECDGFENCSFCHAGDCYCRIKQKTRNSAGEYHDWDDKCDKWEIKEIAE